MKIDRLTFGIVAAALAAATLSTSHAFALETFTFRQTATFEVGTMPDVLLESINGNVSYRGIEGTKATVETVVQIRAEDSAEAEDIREGLELVVQGEAGLLEARLLHADDFYRWLRREFARGREARVSFSAQGPRDAEATLNAVSGDVDVENVAGYVDAASVSGNVTATELGARARISSVSGDIDVSDGRGAMEISSVSGDIDLADCGAELIIESVSGNLVGLRVAGPVTMESVSGDVDLRGLTALTGIETVSGSILLQQDEGGFDLSTTSGDVTVRSAGAGDMKVSSISGNVTLAVNPDRLGDVELESPSGEMGIDVPLKLRQHARDRLTGRLGEGTGTLRVHTSSGDISISQL